jgi:hypothetical protein
MNPDFFVGTAIEDYAGKVLANDSEWNEPTLA